MRRRDVLIGLAGGLGLGASRAAWGQRPGDPAPWADARPAPTELRVLMKVDVNRQHDTVSAVMSRDGALALAGAGDGHTELFAWDSASGRSLYAEGRRGEMPINAIALSPDGSRVAIKTPAQLEMINNGIARNGFHSGCVIRILDAATGLPMPGADGRSLATLGPASSLVPMTMAFTPGGVLRYLDVLGRLTTWDPAGGRPEVWPDVAPKAEDDWPCGGGIYGWSSSDRPLASGDAVRWAMLLEPLGKMRLGRRLRLWDAAAKTLRDVEMNDLIGRPIAPQTVAVSPDGRRLIVCYDEVRIMENGDQLISGQLSWALIDFDTAKIIGHLRVRKGELRSLHFTAFGPDGSEIIAAISPGLVGDEAILSVWDCSTGRPTAAYRTPGPVRDVAFLPGKRLRILVGGVSAQSPLAVWDTPTRDP